MFDYYHYRKINVNKTGLIVKSIRQFTINKFISKTTKFERTILSVTALVLIIVIICYNSCIDNIHQTFDVNSLNFNHDRKIQSLEPVKELNKDTQQQTHSISPKPNQTQHEIEAFLSTLSNIYRITISLRQHSKDVFDIDHYDCLITAYPIPNNYFLSPPISKTIVNIPTETDYQFITNSMKTFVDHRGWKLTKIQFLDFSQDIIATWEYHLYATTEQALNVFLQNIMNKPNKFGKLNISMKTENDYQICNVKAFTYDMRVRHFDDMYVSKDYKLPILSHKLFIGRQEWELISEQINKEETFHKYDYRTLKQAEQDLMEFLKTATTANSYAKIKIVFEKKAKHGLECIIDAYSHRNRHDKVDRVFEKHDVYKIGAETDVIEYIQTNKELKENWDVISDNHESKEFILKSKSALPKKYQGHIRIPHYGQWELTDIKIYDCALNKDECTNCIMHFTDDKQRRHIILKYDTEIKLSQSSIPGESDIYFSLQNPNENEINVKVTQKYYQWFYTFFEHHKWMKSECELNNKLMNGEWKHNHEKHERAKFIHDVMVRWEAMNEKGNIKWHGSNPENKYYHRGIMDIVLSDDCDGDKLPNNDCNLKVQNRQLSNNAFNGFTNTLPTMDGEKISILFAQRNFVFNKEWTILRIEWKVSNNDNEYHFIEVEVKNEFQDYWDEYFAYLFSWDINTIINPKYGKIQTMLKDITQLDADKHNNDTIKEAKKDPSQSGHGYYQFEGFRMQSMYTAFNWDIPDPIKARESIPEKIVYGAGRLAKNAYHATNDWWLTTRDSAQFTGPKYFKLTDIFGKEKIFKIANPKLAAYWKTYLEYLFESDPNEMQNIIFSDKDIEQLPNQWWESKILTRIKKYMDENQNIHNIKHKCGDEHNKCGSCTLTMVIDKNPWKPNDGTETHVFKEFDITDFANQYEHVAFFKLKSNDGNIIKFKISKEFVPNLMKYFDNLKNWEQNCESRELMGGKPEIFDNVKKDINHLSAEFQRKLDKSNNIKIEQLTTGDRFLYLMNVAMIGGDLGIFPGDPGAYADLIVQADYWREKGKTTPNSQFNGKFKAKSRQQMIREKLEETTLTFGAVSGIVYLGACVVCPHCIPMVGAMFASHTKAAAISSAANTLRTVSDSSQLAAHTHSAISSQISNLFGLQGTHDTILGIHTSGATVGSMNNMQHINAIHYNINALHSYNDYWFLTLWSEYIWNWEKYTVAASMFMKFAEYLRDDIDDKEIFDNTFEAMKSDKFKQEFNKCNSIKIETEKRKCSTEMQIYKCLNRPPTQRNECLKKY